MADVVNMDEPPLTDPGGRDGTLEDEGVQVVPPHANEAGSLGGRQPFVG